MKISNSKKELARIISENGGWRDGAQFSAQDKDGEVFHYAAKPTIGAGREVWSHKGCIGEGEFMAEKLPNWHQTLLSRDEYLHLYPAPVEVVVENKTTCHLTVTDKPTIEQLAADYRNVKDYADRKQQEADVAKADAEAKLAELVAAGKARGLVLSVVEQEPEPELVITDWRDLQVGDVIEYVDGDIKNKIGMSGPVDEFAPAATDGMYVRLKCDNGPNKGRIGWPTKWRFIRRPSEDGSNA